MTPMLSLDGHRRKILNMEFNPVAEDVIATGSRWECVLILVIHSDNTCRIWNVFAKQEIISIDLVGAQLQEMKWDFTGSLLCTGLKNREYSIWDPRTVTPVSTWIVCFSLFC